MASENQPRDERGRWTSTGSESHYIGAVGREERKVGDEIVAALRDTAWSDSLRRGKYRGKENCVAGHCYVASEAAYHLLGGKEAGLTPQYVAHEGEPHWFLKSKRGGIIDLTAGQFKKPVPYKRARGMGFLTREPSARAKSLIERVSERRTRKAALWLMKHADHDQSDHGNRGVSFRGVEMPHGARFAFSTLTGKATIHAPKCSHGETRHSDVLTSEDLRDFEERGIKVSVANCIHERKEFDPNQPRDERGRWVDESIGSASQVSYEAQPSTSVDMLRELHSASYEEKTDYLREIKQGAVREFKKLALACGISFPSEFDGPGFFEGAFSPGMQVELQHGGPEKRKDVEAFAAALGLALAQDAVAAHLIHPNGQSQGAELKLGRGVTKDEMARIFENLPRDQRKDIALVPSREGLRLLNFSNLTDDEFLKVVTVAARESGMRQSMKGQAKFRFDGVYISNDWKENKDGAGYRKLLAGRNGGDLILKRVDDLIRTLQNRVLDKRGAKHPGSAKGWGGDLVTKAAIKGAVWRDMQRRLVRPWEKDVRAEYIDVMDDLRANSAPGGRPFDLKKWQARVRERMTPIYVSMWRAAQQDYIKHSRTSKALRLKAKPKPQEFEHEGDFIRALTDPVADTIEVTYDLLQQVLEEAREDQLSAEETQELFDEAWDELFSGKRFDVIATTETHKVINQARHEMIARSGATMMDWLSERDNRVRTNHQLYDAHGAVPLGFNFAKLVGEAYLLRYPYDPECDEPSEIVNCRCMDIDSDEEWTGSEAELRRLLGDTGAVDEDLADSVEL